MTHQFTVGTFVDTTHGIRMPFDNYILKGTTLKIIELTDHQTYRVETFDGQQFGITECYIELSLLECW
jgi:hypothetical protein